jgi:hypothetical protein
MVQSGKTASIRTNMSLALAPTSVSLDRFFDTVDARALRVCRCGPRPRVQFDGVVRLYPIASPTTLISVLA